MNPSRHPTDRPAPPKFARRLLSLLAGERDRRFVLADLDEEFDRRVAGMGRVQAARWYRSQFRRSFVPLLGARLRGLANPSSAVPDLMYALRTLRRSPLSVVVIVLSFGLGVGAMTTVFTVFNQVVLASPVGLEDADRLVTLYTSEDDGGPFGTTSYPDYRDLAQDIPALSGATVLAITPMTLTDPGNPEGILAEEVGESYFEVTGLRPVLGRPFYENELTEGAGVRVAVLGNDLWRRRFSEDPGVIGRSIQLDGRSFTVIGVAPDGVVSRRVPVEPDVWLPLRTDQNAVADRLENRDDRRFIMVGRMAPGATQTDVETQLAVVVQRLRAEHPAAWTDAREVPRDAVVVSEAGSRTNPKSRALLAGVALFFLGATTLVLLIACSNVMGLMLARVSRRRRELAVRSALGASRARLVTMLVTEGLIPGVLGGAVGLALAWWCTTRLANLALPVGVPFRIDVSMDARSIGFAVLVTLVSSLAFALLPALGAARSGPVGFKGGDGIGSKPGKGRPRLRSAMVVLQCAASAALLTGASLFLRALDSASRLDLGVNTTRMAVATKTLDADQFDEESGLAYFEALRDRIAAHPDVETANLSVGVELTLLQASSYRDVRLEGSTGSRPAVEVPSNAVSPGYLETMGIRVLRGRTLEATDRADGVRVAVVTEGFARRFWPGEDALGRTFRVDPRGTRPDPNMPQAPHTLQVVGIAEDGRYVDFDDVPGPYFWTSVLQDYAPTLAITAQGSRTTQEAIEALRSTIALADDELQRIRPSPLSELVSIQFLHLRVASKTLGAGGFFGLLLAAIGVYGMVSFSATRRMREMAIRLAVGADRTQVFRHIVGEGMRLAAIGLVLGFAIAIPIGFLLRGALAGVQPLDPASLLGGAGLLMGVALLASTLPALRSTRVQPMETLREE